MKQPARQRSSAVAALGAAATVALYALGGLSGLFHLAATAHEVCAEHGAMVHPGHLDRPADGAPTPAGRAALAAAVTAAGHGHDHCAIGDHLRQDGLPTPAATLARPAPPAGRAIPCPADRPHRPIAALRLAPKHSPPATT